MLGKFSAEKLNSHMKTLKRHGRNAIHTLGKRYREAREVANKEDKYAQSAKRIYNDLEPTINEVGGDRGRTANEKIKKGFNSYDQIRDRVVDTHGQAEKHVSAVVGALKKEGVNIGI